MEIERQDLGIRTYLGSLMRHKVAASLVFFSILGASVLAAFLQKPVYQAEGRVLVKVSSASPSATSIGEQLGAVSLLYKDTKPLDTEAEILRSVPLIQKTIDRLKLKDVSDPTQALQYQDFISLLTIAQVGSSDTLKILYADGEARKAAQVVNTLMSFYLENDILANRTEATVTRQFLEKQLPKAEFTLRQAEFELRKYKEANQVLDLLNESKAAVDRVTYVQQKLTDVQSLALNAKTQADILAKDIGLTPQQAVSVTSVSQSTAVQDVLLQLQPVERELAVARTSLNPAHPTIKNLEEKVAALKKVLSSRVSQTLGNQLSSKSSNRQVGLLQQNATAQLLNFRAQNIASEIEANALSQALNSYRQKANTLPRIEQKLSELQGNVQSSRSTYDLLSKKYQLIRVTESQNIGNTRIISPALVPLLPIAPRKALYVIFGVLLGALMASLSALLLEMRDKSIRTIEELQDCLELPLLGVIPYDEILEKSSQNSTNELLGFTPEVLVRSFPGKPISESYWMVVSNLKHFFAERSVQRLVVTSSIDKEGKSTVAANIAAAFSESGLKVLLLDANLRQPRQQKIWNLNHSLGLSNLIVDKIELQEVVQRVDKNLDIITAGISSSSPSALLNSIHMVELMDNLSGFYDMIVVDVPALNCASDAVTLGRLSDGILCVLRVGKLDEDDIKFSKGMLSQVEDKVLGIVVNGANSSHESYSYSSYRKHQGLMELEKPQILAKRSLVAEE